MNINAAKSRRSILGLLSLLLISSASAYGVEIDDVLWGFDGTVADPLDPFQSRRSHDR